jgi:hypothetical protein
MNDFTKEELYLISKSMRDYLFRFHKEVAPSPLLEKIQSMIDNYEEDQKVKEALNYIVMKAREWDIKS